MTVSFRVGVKTFAPLQHMRMGHLENCVRSLVAAFGPGSVAIYNNGGYDREAVEAVAAEAACVPIPVYELSGANLDAFNPGFGAFAMGQHMVEGGPLGPPDDDTIIVFSDDDMIWKADACDALRTIWQPGWCQADKVKICSGLLEPDYPWATPRRTLEFQRSRCGSWKEVVGDTGASSNYQVDRFQPRRILVRDNAPGCAWTFRSSSWELLRPLIEHTFGFDHKVCKKLVADGHEVAQADLAEHSGWGSSTHGNNVIDAPETRPLDRKKWKI